MKFLIVLCALIACACAVPYYSAPLLAHAPVTSVTSRLDTYGAKVVAAPVLAGPVVGVGHGVGLVGAPLYGGYGLGYNNLGLVGHGGYGLGYGKGVLYG